MWLILKVFWLFPSFSWLYSIFEFEIEEPIEIMMVMLKCYKLLVWRIDNDESLDFKYAITRFAGYLSKSFIEFAD